MNVIVAQQLTKTFGRGGKAIRALKSVDFVVGAGRVTGLIGHNGAGKSTFIKLALGFFAPNAGRIDILGLAPGSPEAHKRLGYLPEHPSFPLYLSGREILIYVAQLLGHSRKQSSDMALALLEEVGIAHAADRRVQTYSKGMGQRLGLAQALIGNPDLLILDEPMTGLDPIGRSLVKDILRRRHEQGCSIVFCSHILDDVERLCDDVIMLNRGEVVYNGTVDAVLASDDPVWNAFIRAESIPAGIAQIGWQPAGEHLWQATQLTKEMSMAVAQAAAQDQCEIVRLNRKLEDLEGIFVRLTKGEVGDA